MMVCRRLFFLFFFALLSFSAMGQPKEYSKFREDSLAMETYVDSVILFHLREPVVLKMTDTLFDMAQKLNNPRKQALALTYKADYYYIHKIKDSLFAAIDDVQKFSKDNNQLIYYFFSWTRKITYYMSINQINIALNELDLMLRDAVEMGYYPAMVRANTMKGRLYFNKSLYQEAHDSYIAAIDLAENAPEGVEIPGLFSIYTGCAQTLYPLNRINEAKPFLDKALASTKEGNELSQIYLLYSNYFSVIGDFSNAERYINLAKAIGATTKGVDGMKWVWEAEMRLAHARGDGVRYLLYLDSLKSINPSPMYIKKSYALGYELLGDYKKANEYLRQVLTESDSTVAEDMRNDLSEMFVMLEVNKLKAENDKKEMEMKNQVLLFTFILLAVLIIVLTVISVLLIKYYKTNRKLKKSEANLSTAVVKIEEESRAKSDFLRHLSHEIRTPLNSLVGFSYILIESNPDNPDNEQCGKIINECSQHLLKMVNDAVEFTDSAENGIISDLDINSCYSFALEYMPVRPAKGVALRFEPYQGENTIFRINKKKTVIILYNLIHNATKFTTEGEIVVKADVNPSDGEITFTVTDTGIGIPKNKRDYVFEYFSKLDNMSQGLGLGLTISRTMAESMGGSLTIDENYTSGCRMILKFKSQS